MIDSGSGLMNTPLLALKAQCEFDRTALGDPLPVTVILSSVAPEPLWVNARMGMGYENGMFRELYCTIYDDVTGDLIPVSDSERVDVHRLYPKREDFRQLEPAEQVSVTVDVAFWHPIKRAGCYRFVFSYDNQYDGSEFGFRAFTGIIQAEPVVVTIV